MSEREVVASLETDWQQRLAAIVEMMREMSLHTDPQEMVRAYGERIRPFIPEGRRMSLSRRGLKHPQYRITRSSTWTEDINPWKEPHRLPLHTGGLLSELIYGEEPVVIDDLEYSPDDPAAEYFAGHRSLVAIPMYDQGESLNMVVLLQQDRHAFAREDLADYVWRTNLFGRATSTLVLKEELRKAYQTLDRELKIVGEIQRSLLPAKLPKISTLDLAAHYQPAHRAGGDYYDFFPLPEGKWGIFIGDVSGHGTPAAVLMAVTHCIAHTHPGPPMPPGTVLEYINQHLAERYTHHTDTFVTAFFGVYDPAGHTLTYASAGHNPPRLKCCRDGAIHSLEGPGGLPLGIIQHARYEETVQTLHPGDQLIFYTDGITEAHNPHSELFGVERLDAELQACELHAVALMDSVLAAVETFADGRAADDDRTLIVAQVIE